MEFATFSLKKEMVLKTKKLFEYKLLKEQAYPGVVPLPHLAYSEKQERVVNSMWCLIDVVVCVRMGDRTTSVEGVLLTPDAMFSATVQGNPGSAY